MTGQVAARLGLADVASSGPGAMADLVVLFDPATVTDVVTYQVPHRYPLAGIRWVRVNGGRC